VLLVGDAAGYVDALTGEGLAVAFGTSAALVAAVLADRPEQYEHEWRRISRRPSIVTRALLSATSVRRPRQMLVGAAERLPGVFSSVVNVLAG
jgi:flavin-dependent dehydrogenase